MRSVVVVFPASMCALMPMFRYRSMGVVLATFFCCRCMQEGHRYPDALAAVSISLGLEPEVREGLVRLGHAMDFLAFLYRATASFGRLEQLRGQALAHRL